jgi:membrane protease YdiL (CAAX protease family)
VRLAPTPRAPRLSRSSLIVLFYGLLGAGAIVWSRVWGRGEIYNFEPGGSTVARLAMSPLAGVAFGLVAVFLSRLAVHRLEWARVLHREFHAVVHELNAREIFILALASSVGEELAFRGALLPAVGLLPSSALFAAMHLRPQRRFLPWTVMSFVVGAGLGLMFVYLGNLGGPIAAHFTINLLNLNYIAKTELPA